jgi:putative inorganic carbon (HCO3(-)) transporter
VSIVFLALMIPITLGVTALPLTTQPQVYRLLTGIGLFYAIINWTGSSKSRLRLLVLGIGVAGIGLAIFGLFSVEWATSRIPIIPVQIYQFIPTLGSDLIHKNVMAGSLVVILPPLLGVIFFAWQDLIICERIVYSTAALIIMIVLVLTQSRGAILAFGCVLLLLSLLRWRWGWMVVVVLLIIAAIFSYRYGIASILETVMYTESLQGADVRVDIWSRAIYMIQDFSFTGIGFGSYGEIADMFYPFILSLPGSVPHAHNLFLQIAVDLGIPGLIAWLAILLIIVFISWRVLKYGHIIHDGWRTALGAGFLSSQIALMVHGLLDSVTWGMVRPAPIVWAIWGLSIAAWNLYGTSRVKELSYSE